MVIPQHIFKAYDIRGLADSELSPELAYRVGRGYVALLRASGADLTNKRIVVGRDMRPTSSAFAAEVIRGVTDAGLPVVDIGLCSTPLFNFACTHYPEHAAGIMVTASHNPAQYNGFKFTLGNGLPVPGTDLYTWVNAVAGAATNAANTTVTKLNPLADYVTKAFSLVAPPPGKKFKIVIDFGNGMGSVTITELLRQLPQVEATLLYEEPDGSFPNHEANPLKIETLKDLQKKVVAVGADMGFALDGDADRIGLVNERGEVVEASYVALLIGNEVLASQPGATMLYDLRSSQILKEVWEERGARTAPTKVGHANIKKQMQEVGALFASELSLHIYFGAAHNIEFPDVCLLYLLQVMARANQPLSAIVAPFQRYFHSEEINFSVSDKAAAEQAIEQYYKKSATQVSHLDGVWMQFEWGWFNVRASNTESLLRLNVEARSAAELHDKINELTKLVQP